MPEGKLQLLYDGKCPICSREARWLSRLDRRGRVAFVDISAPTFRADLYGLSPEAVQRVLHAIRPDGTTLRALDAVHAAYQAVGLGWITAPTRWRMLRPIFDALYRVFARNRLRLSSLLGYRNPLRCDCEPPDAHPSRPTPSPK